MRGLVIKSTGSWYKLKQEDGSLISARIKGKIRLKDIDVTNPVAVGDEVIYEFEEGGDQKNAVIVEVEKRKNYIIRKSNKLSKQGQIIAANIDLALLVVTLSSPKTSQGFMDRFLLMASAFHIPVALVFHKRDLYDREEQAYFEHLKSIYEKLGYACILTSSLDPEASPAKCLSEIIEGKKSIDQRTFGSGEIEYTQSDHTGCGSKSGNHQLTASEGEAYHHFC